MLKAEAVTPGSCATGRPSATAPPRARPIASAPERELEFAELYARHDRILREAGSLDGGDLVTRADPPVSERADVAATIGERFGQLMVDELEDASRRTSRCSTSSAHPRRPARGDVRPRSVRAPVPRLAGGRDRLVSRRLPEAEELALDEPLRFGGSLGVAATSLCAGPAEPEWEAEFEPDAEQGHVRFWRCRSERAQAQAAAREIEHLLAAGEVIPGDICVVVALRTGARGGWSPARSRSAAFPTAAPAMTPSSSARRSATRSPGCGCWPIPAMPPPWSGR